MYLGTSKRIALAVGAAALSIGIAAPAVACPPNPSSISAVQNAAAHKSTLTADEVLAKQKAWVDSFVTRAQAGLDKLAAKVAADPDISAAKKTAIAAKLVQAQGVLATLKDKVDAASTLDAVHDAVRDAIMTWRSDLAAAAAMRAHKMHHKVRHDDSRAALAAAIKARHDKAQIDAAAIQQARAAAIQRARIIAERFSHFRNFRNFRNFRGHDWDRGWNGHRSHHRGGFGGRHHHG